jgi:molecular chaperone GrpE
MNDNEQKNKKTEEPKENKTSDEAKEIKTEEVDEEEPTCEEGEEKDGKSKEDKGHIKKELRKAKEEIEKLKAQLKSETEELTRKWYAVSAEYENYRRRTQNQASQKYAEGRSDVISSLFPIGDNLERALSSCGDEKTKQGIEMVIKSYKKILETEGIEELDPTGQPFDPAVAEAIMAVAPAEGEESGIVKQVYVKGYKRGDKVLRYAQVIVTQ